jgi:high-affinity iron transporter
VLLSLLVSLAIVPAMTGVTGLLAAEPPPPAAAGRAMRAAFFDAEAALLAGDSATAAAKIAAAEKAADDLQLALTADPAAGEEIAAVLTTAKAAVAQRDDAALAMAHGRLWAVMMRAAYAETLAAIAAGDFAAASAWLLLRDFKPTTQFARPSAAATLALRQLQRGEVTPAAATETIRADLLDTYQTLLETALGVVVDTSPAAFSTSQATAAGKIAGYWPLLAPELAVQQGAAARSRADATFAALLAAAESGDAAAFSRATAEATAIVQSFRAAPLSDAELAKRAGLLLRYLELVPIEFRRGVAGGQVTLDLEIQEARAFLAAARAAFSELRLALRERDAETTSTIESSLNRLDRTISLTASREEIADPAVIETDVQAVLRDLAAILPAAWLEQSGDSDFDVVAALLDQMVAAASTGAYQQAEASRIEAYAIFETGPEKRLLAFTPAAAQRVERLFWEGDGQVPGLQRLLHDQAALAQVRATRQVLDTELTDAQAALNAGTAPAAVIFNAATIVFREGLEAVLILASLLASMIGVNQQYKRPLALGALAALLATAVLFVLARSALLSFGRYSEQIEAIVSVAAIGVLLLVMNWFFHKVYWTRWIAMHHDHRRRLLIGGTVGPAVGFVLLGFSSVFREGAETVLFLQALVLDAGTGVVVRGTLLGLAATAVVGALTLLLQTKLPHKKMLVVTGIMIAVVLVTMVGSTVHTLQLVGWAPISPLPGAERLPYELGIWLGVYGTWQGIGAQVVALAVVLGSYFLAERQAAQTRQARRAVALPSGPGQNTALPA